MIWLLTEVLKWVRSRNCDLPCQAEFADTAGDWHYPDADEYTARPFKFNADRNLMTARHVHLWVWWLLPFLVARALMPVGFMAQAHDGKLEIVFCSAGVSQQGTNHDDADKQHAGSQNDFSCPFAHVAAAPILAISSNEVIPYLHSVAILPAAESPYYASGPPRFIATRGPPRLS